MCQSLQNNFLYTGKSDDDDDDDNDGDDSTTWTKWISTDQANGRGDLELLNNARRRIIVCRFPLRNLFSKTRCFRMKREKNQT